MKINAQKSRSAHFLTILIKAVKVNTWQKKQISKALGAPLILILCFSCNNNQSNQEANKTQTKSDVTAKDILGNPNYLAISYGGYRGKTRDIQPTIAQLKEDMKILSAMGIKLLRTYNVHYAHASNTLEAITQLKKEDPSFEMYVMLGAWIDCKNAFNSEHGGPDHSQESERNEVEITTAVQLAKNYPDIVKIIAVGNEAMVKWATSYYVQPGVILKWVDYLQTLKKSGDLTQDLWITSSDNFASWGGGDAEYHVEDLVRLVGAVDYISMHTYPMHDTHYNPIFWGALDTEKELSKSEMIKAAMIRAQQYAQSQYDSVANYIKELGIDKPIHIGETGWASYSDGQYSNSGSRATDEYKEALFYKGMREWTNKNNISCFYFEAFDEKWKDPQNEHGSENNFGLMTVDGQAKYALWDLVDQGVYEGLTRNGNSITKTYDGNHEALMKHVLAPPAESDIMATK